MNAAQLIALFLLTHQELLTIINRIPFTPTMLGDLNLTTFKGIRTTDFRLYERDGVIGLIPTSERGGPIVQDKRDRESMRVFSTFRLVKGSTIEAHELQNIVNFGPEAQVLERVTEELTQRFADLERDMALTEERMRLGMIQGQLVDTDGSVIEDFFAKWGVVKAPVETWDFSNGTTASLRAQAIDLVDLYTRALHHLPWSGRIGAICGRDAYKKIVTSDAVERLYMGHVAALELAGKTDPFGSFDFGGIEWMRYRGTDDGTTVSIGDDEVKFFPIGAPGMFFDVRGPFEDLDSVNQIGQRRFPIVVPDVERNFYVKPELYTYPTFVPTVPAALRDGVVT